MGFHPDAGASFYLSRLPGYLGEVYFSQFTYQEYIYIYIYISVYLGCTPLRV
jgi:hypothetical protein